MVCNVFISSSLVVIRVSWSDKLDVWSAVVLTNPLVESPTVDSRVLTLVSRPDTAVALVLASALIALALSATPLTNPELASPTVICNVFISSSLVDILDSWSSRVPKMPDAAVAGT